MDLRQVIIALAVGVGIFLLIGWASGWFATAKVNDKRPILDSNDGGPTGGG